MSPVYDCTTDEGRAEGVAKAAEAVRAGEVVVLPTDTVYGVGADAFSAEAVASVLAAKGRGREMPPPVLVPSVRTVDGLATDVPAYARDLIAEFWPGPLTLVLTAQASLMWDLGDTNGTVALRMPQDDVALALLTEVGPLAVTSANLTGQPPATTVTDAAAQLGAAVSVYLDGGPTTSMEVSTIVDCTGPTPTVLRAGAITQDQIDAVLERPAEAQPADAEEPATGAAEEPVAAVLEPTAEPSTDDPGATPADALELPPTSEPAADTPGETHER
ncbi:MAG TPA: L-threonylcarbamoyladenylate synthase [Pedococcus sp.]|nr:L-threonylcarbamoyladenylate synthase [Pedococcus sp.]